MKKLLFLFFLLACAACKYYPEQGIPDIAPYLATKAGIIVFWEAEQSHEVIDVYSGPLIDRWWTQTQQCLGMEAKPPPVRIVDDVHDYCDVPPDSTSAYCWDMEPNAVFHEVLATYMEEHINQTDRQMWKHEFIHHIMESNGRLEHREHKPDWLWQCQY